MLRARRLPLLLGKHCRELGKGVLNANTKEDRRPAIGSGKAAAAFTVLEFCLPDA